MDVRKNSSLSDGDGSEEFVQFLIVADSQLDVSGDDASPLVVLGGVSGELQEFRGEILEDGGHIDRSSGSGTLGVAALSEVSVDSSDGELETGA